MHRNLERSSIRIWIATQPEMVASTPAAPSSPSTGSRMSTYLDLDQLPGPTRFAGSSCQSLNSDVQDGSPEYLTTTNSDFLRWSDLGPYSTRNTFLTAPSYTWLGSYVQDGTAHRNPQTPPIRIRTGTQPDPNPPKKKTRRPPLAEKEK